ncbi:hypothetical protein RUR49_05905 [Pseudoxanthobacter sp. M-2]|uniref:hypothetical protein n=1 Tax=Pseudoxanthobacter sp. M-2 TaxID=3078754 RepID=UPI0038FCCF13
MSAAPALRPPRQTPAAIAAYKTILRDALDRRPSGMRKRLAEALGKNRSFVSQIANPAYPTPIPPGHIDAILDICHFSPTERASFLAAYASAHPRRAASASDGPAARTRPLALRVPDLGHEAKNREFDRLVQDLVTRLARLAEPPA